MGWEKGSVKVIGGMLGPAARDAVRTAAVRKKASGRCKPWWQWDLWRRFSAMEAHRGPGAPWSGGAEGRIPLARRRPSRRTLAEGALVKRADNVPDAPTSTRGDCKPRGEVGESSTLVPQRGCLRGVPWFDKKRPPAARGRSPLTPAAVARWV